jgi:hypothetical protein
LQAEAEWLCEYLKMLSVTEHGNKEAKEQAIKLVEEAKTQLKNDPGGDELEPGRFAGRLTGLRLLLKARSYEIDLISDECLPLHAHELRRDIEERLEGLRRDTMLEHLRKACDDKGHWRRELLKQIVQFRNDHGANQHVRNTIIRGHLSIIMICVLFYTLLLIVYYPWHCRWMLHLSMRWKMAPR